MTHARVERFAAILAIWHMADNAWQMADGKWHITHSIWHLASAIRHLPSGICHPASDVCHLPFAICHSVFNADNRGGVTSLLRTHFFRQTGRFSMVFTASDVCGASPNQQALRTFCLLRASFPLCSF